MGRAIGEDEKAGVGKVDFVGEGGGSSVSPGSGELSRGARSSRSEAREKGYGVIGVMGGGLQIALEGVGWEEGFGSEVLRE